MHDPLNVKLSQSDFRRVRIQTKGGFNRRRHVRLSPPISAAPTGRFSNSLMLGTFTTICRATPILLKIGQNYRSQWAKRVLLVPATQIAIKGTMLCDIQYFYINNNASGSTIHTKRTVTLPFQKFFYASASHDLSCTLIFAVNLFLRTLSHQ
jgi:hypothetical protein